jgi:predicted PurR-regulated permease PerM
MVSADLLLQAFGGSKANREAIRHFYTATNCVLARYPRVIFFHRARQRGLLVSKPDAVEKGLHRRSLLALTDPMPPLRLARLWRTAAQAATIGIFVVLVIGALHLARPILLPATSAFVATMMLGPLSQRAQRLGIPTPVTAIVLWLLVAVVFYGLLVLLAVPAVSWIGRASEIGSTIESKLHLFEPLLRQMQSLRDTLLPPDSKGNIGVDIMNFVQPAASIVVPGIEQVLIFFGTLFFMLLGRSQLRRVVVAFFDHRDARLRALKVMNDIEHNLTGYLSIVAVINIGMGLGAGLIAWAIGLPNPIAWAVLAFILNFLPYIGAFIMEVSLFLVGVVTFPTLTQAVIPPILYLALATLEANFITPSLVGHRLTLNPLTVFLSLVFWAWLWGPVGAFLSAPLLIVGLVIVGHLFPDEQPELPE